MKLSRVLLIICCLPFAIELWVAIPTFANTLHTWKDKNGVENWLSVFATLVSADEKVLIDSLGFELKPAVVSSTTTPALSPHRAGAGNALYDSGERSYLTGQDSNSGSGTGETQKNWWERTLLVRGVDENGFVKAADRVLNRVGIKSQVPAISELLLLSNHDTKLILPTCSSFSWPEMIASADANPLAKCNLNGPEAKIEAGPYSSGVWISDVFQGNHCREMDTSGTTLYTYLLSNTGGFDTGIGRRNPTLVDDLAPGLVVSAKTDHNLEGEGNWWIGPKIGTRPCQYSSLCPDIFVSQWFENYVIENASRTPQEYEQRILNRPGGRYLGETFQDGSVYKHYFKPHKDWGQYWAIRQNYRTSGDVNVKSIFDFWRQHGQPNDYLVQIRMNFESSGNLCGSLLISDAVIPENWTSNP